MGHLTARERGRRMAKRRLAEVEALAILARRYGREQREEISKIESTLSSGTRAQLDHLLTYVTAQRDELVAVLKPSQPLKWYVDFVANVEIDPLHYLFLAKWELKHFLPGIVDMHPAIQLLPEHALLSIDIHGISPTGSAGELRILEASLFEDMAALYNRAADLTPSVQEGTAPKPVIKECAASRRATVLAAFYVLEAYLNSIAFDYLVAHESNEPTPETDLITEWDHKKNRMRRVSFRGKLLQYRWMSR